MYHAIYYASQSRVMFVFFVAYYACLDLIVLTNGRDTFIIGVYLVTYHIQVQFQVLRWFYVPWIKMIISMRDYKP